MVVVLLSDRTRAVASGAPACFQRAKNRARRTCCVTDAVSERRNEEKKKEVSKKEKNDGKWGEEGLRTQNTDGGMARGGPTGANYRFLWQPL